MARKKGNQVFSIVFAVIWGVITGVLWAYANPIQLVPGVIQWRIFAFLPPVIGILFGPISGFISGYLGSVVWGLLAGTFIPAHTLIVDGIMVGVTGLVRSLRNAPPLSNLITDLLQVLSPAYPTSEATAKPMIAATNVCWLKIAPPAISQHSRKPL